MQLPSVALSRGTRDEDQASVPGDREVARTRTRGEDSLEDGNRVALCFEPREVEANGVRAFTPAELRS